MTTDELRDASLARRAVETGAALALRLSARVSQRETAGAIGCSQSALSRYEHATRIPRGAIAARYGRLLRQWSADA